MSGLLHGATWSREDINAKRAKVSKQSDGRKKISERVIKEIRALSYYKGSTVGDLAKRYNLPRNSIKNVLSGVTGAFVTYSEADIPAAE